MNTCEFCRQPYDPTAPRRGCGPRFCSQGCINRWTATKYPIKQPPPELAAKMTGICNCGCGLPTTPAPRTSTIHNWYRGWPRLYRQGHTPKRGAAHKNWKGGRYLDGRGYWRVFARGHPKANHGYAKEHILIYEREIGSIPPGSSVHHINGCKTDNRPENLVAVTESEHRKLHKALKD